MELNVSIVEMIICDYLKHNNYSESTKKSMLNKLKLFNSFLYNTFKIIDFRNVKEEHYINYSVQLKSKLSLSTINNYGSYLKKIFDILERENKILLNPFYKIKYFKTDKNLKDKVLSEEEIAELLSIPDVTTKIGFRNRTILEVFYGTGVRIQELVNLEVKDFLMDEKLLFIRQGKGKKDRILPVGDNLSKYLYEYLKIRRKLLKGKKAKYLFVRFDSNRLTTIGIRTMLRNIVSKMKVQKKISPHTLRRTFATHLLKNGVGIREIQIMLGHSNISSTQIYINLNKQHLKSVYEKYHPLENELFFDVYGREDKVIKGLLEVGIDFRGNI